MTLTLSTARADITPTAMAEMGGYGGNSPRLATGIYSPLMARVLILWDPNPKAIVTLDAGTLPPAWHQALRPRLVALAPWASADIAVLCTHTHNGPMTLSHPDPWITYAATDLGACADYWAGLADQVVALVEEALAAAQTAVTLDYQSISQTWSKPRTQPTTYTETAVPVLVARDLSGQPAAVLFGYGCHAVTAGVQTEWDGDYPAAACSVIEAAIPGVHAQFIAGSGGDQEPIGTRNWRLRDKLGAQLGSAVVSAVATVGRPLAGPITTSLSSATIPLQVPSDPAGWAEFSAGYAVRVANPGPYAAEPWYPRHAQQMVDQIAAGMCETSIVLPIQVWRLGSPMLRILLMGGEPVSGFGLWARNHYGGTANIMVGGYANEVPCYVVGNTFFPPVDTNGSYEGGWHSWNPALAGGSLCCYGYVGHFRYSPDPLAAEPVILAALTAALA